MQPGGTRALDNSKWISSAPPASKGGVPKSVQSPSLPERAPLLLGDLDTADERLHHALARARAIEYVDQELPTLIALADLHRRRNEPALAHALLAELGAPEPDLPPFDESQHEPIPDHGIDWSKPLLPQLQGDG